MPSPCSNCQNVLDHGAIGNGSADDTPALVAAYNAIKATGGTIYFPPGTYRISDWNVAAVGEDIKGITVAGAGRDVTILKAGSGATAIIHLAKDWIDPSEGTLVSAIARDFELRDLTLDGNDKASIGVRNVFGEGVTVERVTFSKCLYGYELRWSDHTKLINCYFSECTHGVHHDRGNSSAVDLYTPRFFQNDHNVFIDGHSNNALTLNVYGGHLSYANKNDFVIRKALVVCFYGCNWENPATQLGTVSTALFNAPGGVNTATNQITTTAAHNFVSGDLVRYNPAGGTVVGGLIAFEDYYVAVINSTTVRFHLTQYLRTIGTLVDLTSGGAGGQPQQLIKLSGKDSLIKVGMDALAIDGTNVAPATDIVGMFQHEWCLAQIVIYDANGNPPIPGLTSLAEYFVIPFDANSIRLATSEANARSNSYVNITGTSTGNHIFKPRAGLRTINWYGGFSLAPGSAGVSLFARFLDPFTLTYPSAFRASISGMSIYDFANLRLVGGRAGGFLNTGTVVGKGYFDRNQIGAGLGPAGPVWTVT